MKTMYFYDNISLSSSKNEKCFKVTQKIKTPILCSTNFLLKLRLLGNSVENEVQPVTPQMTI